MPASYGMSVVQGMQISWNSWKPLGKLLGYQYLQARNPYTLKRLGDFKLITIIIREILYNIGYCDGRRVMANLD